MFIMNLIVLIYKFLFFSFQLIYVGISLFRWDDPVRSQSGIGIAGVILVSITVAAGLGFCALLGIAFNAATTQIIPFLALGLGVDNMFHLTHTYAESDSEGNINVSIQLYLKTHICKLRASSLSEN